MGFIVTWSVFLIFYTAASLFLGLFSLTGLIANFFFRQGPVRLELKKTTNLVLIGLIINSICMNILFTLIKLNPKVGFSWGIVDGFYDATWGNLSQEERDTV
jgi:hypothetical protein